MRVNPSGKKDCELSHKTNLTAMNYLLIIIPLLTILSGCDIRDNETVQSVTTISDRDYLRDPDPVNLHGDAIIVVEIPAGDNAKWEVDKVTGHLEWERIGGDSLRVVRYLPYPANYGTVPRTLLPVEAGGDNDPIDIFLLGPSLPRSTIAAGRIIGVVSMTDRGEQDDKLIAVDPGSWFSGIHSIEQLDEEFPGITGILALFLENYKGPGYVEIIGIKGADEARLILQEAIDHFEAAESVSGHQ
jgi:inorganic pyrophosphatase